MPKNTQCIQLKDLKKSKKLALNQYDVVGYGRAFSHFEGGTHVMKLDMNPQAVAQSFCQAETEFKKALYNSTKSFLPDIKSDTIDFKIYVTISPLNESTYTYLYNFILEFKHALLTEKIDASLLDLTTKLQDLREKIINNFKLTKKQCKHFDFDHAKGVINRYNLSNIQKNSPVLSAVEGRFNLSCVDVNNITDIQERSKNIDGTHNKFVHEAYCRGAADDMIAESIANLTDIKKRLSDIQCAAADKKNGEINEDVLSICLQGGTAEDAMEKLGLDEKTFYSRFPNFYKYDHPFWTQRPNFGKELTTSLFLGYVPTVNTAASVWSIFKDLKKVIWDGEYTSSNIIDFFVDLPTVVTGPVGTIFTSLGIYRSMAKKHEAYKNTRISIPKEIAKVKEEDIYLAKYRAIRKRVNPKQDEIDRWVDNDKNPIDSKKSYWVDHDAKLEPEGSTTTKKKTRKRK